MSSPRDALLGKLLKHGKPTMSLDAYGELVGISRNLAYAGAKRGEIPTIRIGKRILVLTVPLADMLCGKEVQK